jgi:Putative transposase.
MTLDDAEFVRRFALHILPKGFMKIRHYGILSSTCKKNAIPRIREQAGEVKIVYNDERKLKVFNPRFCPCCGKESMVTIEIISLRGHPKPNITSIADYSAFSEMPCTTIS